jgi:hypothetical protein
LNFANSVDLQLLVKMASDEAASDVVASDDDVALQDFQSSGALVFRSTILQERFYSLQEQLDFRSAFYLQEHIAFMSVFLSS